MLVSWQCFQHSQPLGLISELKETFVQRYTAERTNKPEIKPEKQSEKRELSGEFMERNTVERAIKTETDTRTASQRLATIRQD